MRLTFRKKALLFIIPILIFISLVYTYEAIRTEEEITRAEIIKRAEAITKLATRTGELPILSGNPELLKKNTSFIMDAPDVVFISFYDRQMNQMIHDGRPFREKTPILSPEAPVSFFEEPGLFVFYAPVFTAREKEDIGLFDEGGQGLMRENIGWVRIGFSKSSMNEALKEIVVRSLIFLLIFVTASSAAAFILMTIATRPLRMLSGAVKSLRNGKYQDIVPIKSGDEIGELSEEFNKMNRAIQEREKRLVESEKRIRELFERVEHAIFRLDREGNIVRTNRKFDEICGRAGRFCELFSGKNAEGCLRRAFRGEMRNSEEKIKGKDGNELNIFITIYPDVGEDGEATGYDGYFLDITEKKRLEEVLLQTQKMEAVGTLAGGIAHDFNNVLTAILGYSELLKSEMDETDPKYKAIHIIQSSAQKGAALASRILNVTRKEKFEFKIVNLNRVIQETIELLSRSIPKVIAIEVNLDKDLPAVKADAVQLQQVIMNLAVNAVDAMPDGGRLMIETSCDAIKSDFLISKQSPDRFVKLSISDTGKGIEKSLLHKIFDPFFTTKIRGSGTGLGLYIVHSIVLNHSGYIDLFTEPGEGTRFDIYFPVSIGIEDYDGLSETEDIRGAGTILIIDDEPDVREILKDILQRHGFTVLTASEGREGVHIYRLRKKEIDLVVLDMIMPLMNGTEVLQILKSINQDVKVIFVSGYQSEGFADIDKLTKDSICGFVQKPFTINTMTNAINEALKKD